MTIRSSSLVNDATGVKIFKENVGGAPEGRPSEPKKRSTQAEKIAAAAAAVGPGRGGRGRKPEAKGPGAPADKRPGNQGPKREGKPGAPRNPQGQPRDGKPSGRRGEPHRDGRPRDPAMKDRLDYYKSKYGEEFKPTHVEEKASKPGILGKIAGLFGLGKKKDKK